MERGGIEEGRIKKGLEKKENMRKRREGKGGEMWRVMG